jgi:DNA-binding NarL/FixJ family response regulator
MFIKAIRAQDDFISNQKTEKYTGLTDVQKQNIFKLSRLGKSANQIADEVNIALSTAYRYRREALRGA